MRGRAGDRVVVMAVLAGMAAAPAARGVRIGDVTHLQGQRINRLTGIGLVVGLKGTGDGGDFLVAIRPLAQFLAQFSNPVASAEELKNARNVAIVSLEAVLPDHGVREGDRVDVYVTAVGAAKSLAGGRLIVTPMQGPTKQASEILALAAGPVYLRDESVPTSGVIPGGAVLEANVIHNYLARGEELAHHSPWIDPQGWYITFVISDPHASWAMANAIAQAINERAAMAIGGTEGFGAGGEIALAVDPRNVLVRVPDVEVSNPAPFIADLQKLDLFVTPTEARVVVNRRTETIVVTGDVEILPGIVAYRDLTITVTAPAGAAGGAAPGAPGAAAPAGMVQSRRWIPIDPARQGGTKLQDLLRSLDQLQVPVRDQINIIEELDRTGRLLGRLIVDEG